MSPELNPGGIMIQEPQANLSDEAIQANNSEKVGSTLATGLAARASELRATSSVPDDKWMLDLHRDFTARFISDNTRIWTSGSIFVGIAFASLAISPDLGSRSALGALAAASTSVYLLVVWNIIADRHREFQQRSLDLMDEIEIHFIGEKASPASRRRWWAQIRAMRWSLPVALLAGWAAKLSPIWLP